MNNNQQLRVLPGEPRLIPLTKGKSAIVDADWHEMLSLLKWSCDSQGYASKAYWPSKKVRTTHESMSRFIMDAPKGMVVDHINGNKLDNRRCNLRLCTDSGNNQNRTKRPGICSSNYKGVHFHNGKKRWIAKIRHNGKSIHLGNFSKEVDAAIAHNAAAVKFHGEFAKLNTIYAYPYQPEAAALPAAPKQEG